MLSDPFILCAFTVQYMSPASGFILATVQVMVMLLPGLGCSMEIPCMSISSCPDGTTANSSSGFFEEKSHKKDCHSWIVWSQERQSMCEKIWWTSICLLNSANLVISIKLKSTYHRLQDESDILYLCWCEHHWCRSHRNIHPHHWVLLCKWSVLLLWCSALLWEMIPNMVLLLGRSLLGTEPDHCSSLFCTMQFCFHQCGFSWTTWCQHNFLVQAWEMEASRGCSLVMLFSQDLQEMLKNQVKTCQTKYQL